MRHFLVLCILSLTLSACSNTTGCDNSQSTEACVRILFIGNSYTNTNDLPAKFAELARAGKHRVEVEMVVNGGWTLAQHFNSSETLNKISAKKWNYVVLQEQSQIPSLEQSRTATMYPAARSLVSRIQRTGARTIFYLTWAHRDGWPENGLTGFESMQWQITNGYLKISQELNVPVAPVGQAWLNLRRENPQLNLWQEDGSHPNDQGTYLAACVFYAVIFRTSPEGLTYTANIPATTAQILQKTAARTVLDNPKQWNLP